MTLLFGTSGRERARELLRESHGVPFGRPEELLRKALEALLDEDDTPAGPTCEIDEDEPRTWPVVAGGEDYDRDRLHTALWHIVYSTPVETDEGRRLKGLAQRAHEWAREDS